MRPLPTSQLVMTWLCMCPADESTSKKKRLCYAAFTLMVGTIICAVLLTSGSFIIKYLSTDFEGCLYAVFQVAAHTAMLNLIIVGLINRQRIADLFTELSKLYTANEAETSFQFFAEANDKSEWLWSVYFKFGIIGFLLNVFVSTLTSITYCFYQYGIFDADHLYKPFIFLLPWNQTSTYGYFGELGFSIVACESYFICNGTVIILFTSICLHHQAFYKRFRHTLLKMDQCENRQSANEILRELHHFHITIKDWLLQSAEVYSPFVLIQLICHMIYMAAVVFELDLRIKYIDFEFFLLLNAFPVGISNLYVYCYFGQLATESYEQMTDCLYESNWHELSLDLQKKALLMILNMQTPVFYNGFGVAVLNLATFIKFIRAIFTYYMMFKTLTE